MFFLKDFIFWREREHTSRERGRGRGRGRLPAEQRAQLGADPRIASSQPKLKADA